ncbi:class I SAM-dependent methyltransferase [Candidatus Woesearchaeota archaeon]|nr:class I SAM-dependent methyltransferase [Candidatus Woesearchaeota archaeon]
MTYDAKEHWENIYQTKKSNEVSWHQKKPKTSLNLISGINLDKGAKIIDIGAGDSKLVDNLLAVGFRNITVLDVSSNALNRVKKRLGNRANDVKWIVSDLMEFKTNNRYDLWHDRAVLHFLTEEEEINRYVERVRQLLKPNGYLIVSTFSENGPKKCSGLYIKQYSEDSMKKLFSGFEHIKSFEEEHLTPWGDSQIFIYGLFKEVIKDESRRFRLYC